MGIQLNARPVAMWLLLASPLVVLIVPQGTIERSFVPELFFIAFMLLTMAATCIAAGAHVVPFSMSIQQVRPVLLLSLSLLLFLNPVWSVALGNDPMRIVMTALPFAILGVYYLLALIHPSRKDVLDLLACCALSGAVLGVVVIGNFFFGDLSSSAMRSTAIEGNRTLSLPILPMGAVIALSLSLTNSASHRRYFWAVMTAICVVAILMSVTRAMLGSFLVGASISVTIIFRRLEVPARRKFIRAVAVGVAGITALGIPLLSIWLERLDPTSDNDVATVLGRLDEYQAFLDGFMASPIIGQGLGHMFTFPSLFDMMLRENGITVCHSHLFFIAGTTGLLGIILYYFPLVATFFELVRRTRHTTGGRANEGLGALAGMAGSLVAGILFTLTSTTFTTLAYNLFLAIFLLGSRIDWRDV